MECEVDFFREFYGNTRHTGQLLDTCLLDTLQTAKMMQQVAAALGPYSR